MKKETIDGMRRTTCQQTWANVGARWFEGGQEKRIMCAMCLREVVGGLEKVEYPCRTTLRATCTTWRWRGGLETHAGRGERSDRTTRPGTLVCGESSMQVSLQGAGVPSDAMSQADHDRCVRGRCIQIPHTFAYFSCAESAVVIHFCGICAVWSGATLPGFLGDLKHFAREMMTIMADLLPPSSTFLHELSSVSDVVLPGWQDRRCCRCLFHVQTTLGGRMRERLGVELAGGCHRHRLESSEEALNTLGQVKGANTSVENMERVDVPCM